MTSRYAAYYAPAAADPLWRAGCDWLGRDPAGGGIGARPPLLGLDAVTADAAGYGFHATLKPPMRLRDGASRDDLLAALRQIATTVPRFPLPPLRVDERGGFLCLTEAAPSPALQALSDAAVAGLDHLRAPPSEAELRRRRGAGLSPVREANLCRWGYPDVFATWFFHMTLSCRLPPQPLAAARAVGESWFAEALARSRQVVDICVFEQDGGAPFRLTERVALT